jgi:hypothetical protein
MGSEEGDKNTSTTKKLYNSVERITLIYWDYSLRLRITEIMLWYAEKNQLHGHTHVGNFAIEYSKQGSTMLKISLTIAN